ncbi:hypothetical protein Cadr_000008465 [Camelus dromedarius]|uniref:Uncharacterized protein n=1 Tax=Camelus dromedarius TaxID=9838 RepID=A0A5N4DYH2_CAMDR|nr:hypothetical protein Cadr_000008465 [Camelus dromedarius]
MCANTSSLPARQTHGEQGNKGRRPSRAPQRNPRTGKRTRLGDRNCPIR